MRYQGKIITWKDEKGFGFIRPDSGGNQVFVHVRSFTNGQRRPVVNDIVTYELKTDAKGRPQAGSVVFLGERVSSAISFVYRNGSLIVTAVFLAFVAVSVFTGKLPIVILWLYLTASAVTFVVYAFDKSAAKNDRWRTQECTLHFFALIGGWPCALSAQRLLRHKSKKQTFQIVFWVTVVLNCGALGWLFSLSGARALHSVLGVGLRI
ncbi:MAG: cold shock and DUF1294 domain-containing protein [Deltaproteobacteria bacterium]|nr:cold shock and DUF1294 domain-containing protein [Deltaproteobacteria bacterium]